MTEMTETKKVEVPEGFMTGKFPLKKRAYGEEQPGIKFFFLFFGDLRDLHHRQDVHLEQKVTVCPTQKVLPPIEPCGSTVFCFFRCHLRYTKTRPIT